MTGKRDSRVEAGMRRQGRLLRGLEEQGCRQVGWKVGVGSAPAMARLGIAVPLVGFLTDRTRLENAAQVDIGSWVHPMAEAEVAVVMASDLDPAVDAAQVHRTIAGLAPAIELADVEPPPTDPEAVLAGNIFHRAFILGPARPCAIEELSARTQLAGAAEVETRDLQELTGPLTSVLLTVADIAARHGRGLRTGDVVLTGSVIPLQALRPGDEFTYRLAGFDPLVARFPALT